MEMVQQNRRPTEISIRFSQSLDDSDTDGPETTLSYAKLLLEDESPGCLLVDGYRDREDPRTPKHSIQQNPSLEEGCLTTNRVWIYLETEFISKERSPEMKRMSESGTAVRLWPLGQVYVVHVTYGTRLPGFPSFRLSYTPHGNCTLPSKRT